ncbi:MAG: ABC transporter ATP-binding protein [Desulfovibrio sp.]|nr:ABC transporter ATP-binding protein [Desulfovibrio sp.]
MSDPRHASSDAAIFALEHVSFSYESGAAARQALNDVSLSLLPGQRLGLYGPNGSGKTTLFRCITGLLRPQQGRIFFHGALLEKEEEFHALRCRVGYVLQHAEDQLFFPSVLEDVAFGPLNLGLSADAARERALETLSDLGLVGYEQRLTHRLSGGEKKLVSLAAVLAMQPEALLLDEPSNDLDNEARERIIHILSSLDTARITISHDWDFLTRVSTSYLAMEHGHVQTCAPTFQHVHAHPWGDAPHAH